MSFLVFLPFEPFGYWWLPLVAVAYGAARWGGRSGSVAAHVLISLFVVAFDWYVFCADPDWDGTLTDFAFAAGIHAVLINTVLLPVGFIALSFRDLESPTNPNDLDPRPPVSARGSKLFS